VARVNAGLQTYNVKMRPRPRRICNYPARRVICRFMIRVVLFDIDGTLVHSGGVGTKAFARAFATEFGISHGTEKMKFAGRTDVSLVREFFCNNQIEPSPANFDRFFKAYLHWLEKMIPDCEGGACRGVPEFCVALERLPQPPALGLLTGNIRQGARLKLQRFNLWERFPFGAFADDHEERDRIAAVARERSGAHLGQPLRGEEILVIGDTPLDIRCARAIQARVVAVATGSFTVEELRQHQPDWAVTDLSEISVPEVLGLA
jgi:phosphoglycolate phosphatase